MLVECSNCGAPLDAKSTATVAKCSYCGQKNRHVQARTIAAQTPTNWRPPPRWTPPAHVPATSQKELRYHKRSGAGCMVLLPVAIGLLAPAIGIFASSGGGAWLKTATWDEKSTLECGINGELELEDIKATVKNGPVIDLATNCKLRLKNSKLKGKAGIRAGMNAKIWLENVTIETRDAAIEASTNLELHAGPKCKLSSKDVALRVGTNAELHLSGTKVHGEQAAVEGKSNLELTATDASKLSGTSYAITTSTSAKIELRSSAIQSPAIAINASSHLELRLGAKSWIDGGQTAVRASSLLRLDMRKGKIQSKGTAIEASHNAKINCNFGTIAGKQAFKLSHNAKLGLTDCKVTGTRSLGSNAKIDGQ